MYWLLIARDKTGVQALRAATRERHRAYIWRRDLPARLVLGSPLVADDEDGGMQGSWLLLEAPDRAAVEAFARDDPYAEAGLFATTEILALHDAFDLEAQLAKHSESPKQAAEEGS